MIRTLYNSCWYAVGGIILLAAILVTAGRLLLTDIGSYREYVEAWVSRDMGHPVIIQSIHADWRGWTPQLYLQNVTLLDDSSDRTIAEFKSVHINYNPLQSLRHRELIPESLTINGVRLMLVHRHDGSIIAVHPDVPSELYDEYLVNDEMVRWLLSQPNIELRDSRIDWFDARFPDRRVNLHEARLHLRNDGQRTQITGNAQLARQQGKSIDFALDFTGDLLGGDWQGRIYANGKGLLLASWPIKQQWAGLEIGAGRSDLEIWSDWRHARLTRLDGTIDANDLLVLGSARSNLIHSLAGDFTLEFGETDDDWHLHSYIRDLSTHHGVWPASRLELKSRADRRLSGYADFLRIEDILSLLPVETAHKHLRQFPPDGMSISGDMESMQFAMAANDDHWHIRAEINELSFLDKKNNVHISGLSGDVDMDHRRGEFGLHSRTIDLSLPDLFAQPLTGLSGRGHITWQLLDKGMIFRTDDLGLELSDLNLQLVGKLHIHENLAPKVDLVARTRSEIGLEILKDYVPLTASRKLRDWINRAIVGGRLEYADMVFRGDPGSLPFKQQEGRLKLHAKFTDVTLDYDENWPPVYHLEAGLTLDQDRLTTSIPSGRIYDASIHDTTASIDNVFDDNAILLIDGNIDSHVRDALKFLDESPLHDNVQIRRVRDLDADGEIALTLDMQIPLSPDPGLVEGQVELLGNHLISSSPDLELTDVEGIVKFTKHSIESRELQGRFHGEHVDLGILRKSGAPTEPTIMRMSGSADSHRLADMLSDYVPDQTEQVDFIVDHLSGRTAWEVEVITRPEHRHLDTITATSDLRGLSVDLPEPLAKPADEPRQIMVQLSTSGSGDALNHVRLDYADILRAIMTDNHISLYFGEGQPDTVDTSAELAMQGTIPSLPLDDWIDLYMGYRDQFRGWHQELPVYEAAKIDLNIDSLSVFNQHLPHARLHMVRQQDDWLLDISGDNIVGTVNIPLNLTTQPVIARLEKLHMKPLDMDTRSRDPDLDPRTLPAFNIEVADFIYGDTELGSLLLEASKTPNGLLISEFDTEKSGMTIDGRGNWHAINNKIISEFELDLHAERFSDMLLTFGYSVIAIEDGETNIQVEATWPGSPAEFSLADLDGSLTLDIRKGQFLDIEPRAGRLFGLLSIQTLPRRLSLDFADIFRKGLAFDRISGTYEIRDGNAYTEDLVMEGPASKVAISGRTGIVDQDYDQIVTVTPHVSDTLPLASAFFGPAGIGIGAIILLAGQIFEAIPEQIDSLLRFQYTMTGPWQDPVIEPYQRAAAEQPLRELGTID